MKLPRPVLLLFALMLAATTLTGCGGDDDADNADTGTRNGAQEEPADAGDDAVGEAIEVSAVDNSFSPSSLTLEAGAEVTIEVTNDGSNPHTLAIDGLDASTGTLNSGDSGSVTFTVPDGGATYFCEVHGLETMSGSIDA